MAISQLLRTYFAYFLHTTQQCNERLIVYPHQTRQDNESDGQKHMAAILDGIAIRNVATHVNRKLRYDIDYQLVFTLVVCQTLSG